jgi:predicted DNA-binding antitoxin AbrB/MazE fold protein
MVIRGRVQNGVVVLEENVSLPEGTAVTVAVCAAPEATAEAMSEEQRRRLREARRHFESLPNENPGDTFSGAAHDRVLYGEG